MGYAPDFKYTIRKLSDHIVIASAPLVVANYFNLGARMALIQHGDSIIIWSAMPYGPVVIDSLKLLTGKDKGFNVTHLIVPNREHILAPASYKGPFPNITIIVLDKVRVPGVEPDMIITEKYANKVLSGDLLKEAGVPDKVILDNFEFVALHKHKNRELVVFDKKLKTIFQSDLIVNTGAPGQPSEQFSVANGFEEGYNPNTGWSFITRYMQPKSIVGGYIARSLARAPDSAEGLKAIESWDFNTIVGSHGNVIETDGKEALRSIFKSVL